MFLSLDDVIEESEKLHLECKHQDIIIYLNEQEDEQVKYNVEVVWRLARAYYNESDLVLATEDKDEKLKLIDISLQLINSKIITNPEHPELYKWWAIAMGGKGDYISPKEKISNAPKIKEYALKSLQLKPGDWVTLFVLGRWSYTISSITWLERTFANTIFGQLPTSTFNEALDYFLESYKINPLFIRNVVSIGDCYTQLSQQAKAKEYYEIASKLIPKNDFELKFVNEAISKIK